MTITQIIESVSRVTGNYCKASFFRDRRRLKLKPIGIRQRPQHYSHHAVDLILARRGFEAAFAAMLPPADTALAALNRLPSLPELKRERRMAKSSRR